MVLVGRQVLAMHPKQCAVFRVEEVASELVWRMNENDKPTPALLIPPVYIKKIWCVRVYVRVSVSVYARVVSEKAHWHHAYKKITSYVACHNCLPRAVCIIILDEEILGNSVYTKVPSMWKRTLNNRHSFQPLNELMAFGRSTRNPLFCHALCQLDYTPYLANN